MSRVLVLLLALLLVCERALSAVINLEWGLSVGNQGTTHINTGDTVVWTWSDFFTHSVRSMNGKFTSSSIVAGEGTTHTVTFNTAGTYPYMCDIHTTAMQGVIQVSGSPTLAPAHASSDSPVASSSPTATPTFIDPNSLLSEKLTYPHVVDSGKDVPSEWTATLVVREHRHSNSQVSFTTRSYCYQSKCTYPGPTIAVLPGDNFTLVLTNELGPTPHNEHIMNHMHSPNTTNIHTHGLHIGSDVDTVFVHAAPGETITYPYKIRDDHAPGLMWYHAHYHGSSTMQLMSGLVGALVVKPAHTGKQRIPASITEADAHILVVTKLVVSQETSGGKVTQGCGVGYACDPVAQAPLCTGEEESSPFNMFRVYSIQEFNAECGSDMELNVEVVDPDETDMDLVNGMFRPTLHLVQGSPSILHTVNAFGGAPLSLSVSDASCSIHVIAWDGVYMEARLEQQTVNIPGAGRASFEIVCDKEGVFIMRNGAKHMMTLFVNSTGVRRPTVTDSELKGIVRPWYLQDLFGDDVVVNHRYSVHISQDNKPTGDCGYWMGLGSDCSAITPHGSVPPNPHYVPCSFSKFKGERGLSAAGYLPDHRLVTYVGAVNEWTIYGLGSAHHPLHVHVNHMQVTVRCIICVQKSLLCAITASITDNIIQLVC
mmetsp:Transcript_4776/g.7266  ORF Transcript_4776/g.7266 Transcript_4776/m.7266 type:complete len:653 (+) Transcript_4776:95-2053(+)